MNIFTYLKKFTHNIFEFYYFLYIFCGIQGILFYFLLFKSFLKTPLIQTDQFTYVFDVSVFYNNFSLVALKTCERPIFSFLSAILLKISGIALTFSNICLTNTIFYHLMLILSLLYIGKKLNLSKLTIIMILSVIFSMPIFFDLSSVLMGDVAMAAWSILLIALFVSLNHADKNELKLILIGIITALGVQIKPICAFYSFIIIASYIIIQFANISIPKRELSIKNSLLNSFCFLIGFLPLALLIYPNNLANLIHELYYNNEKMQYWKSFEGIFNSILWFPSVLLREISIIPALILSLFFCLKIYRVIKQFVSNKSSLEYLLSKKYLFIMFGFFILLLYVCFLVQSKDARTFLFLIPIFILIAGIIMESQFTQKTKLYSGIIIFIVFVNLINTLCWSQKLPLRNVFITNNFIKLDSLKLENKRPGILDEHTYLDLGIPDILAMIDKYQLSFSKDSQSYNSNNRVIIFTPNRVNMVLLLKKEEYHVFSF